MYVRVCVCVGQTLLSYARGFPRGPRGLIRQHHFLTSSAHSHLVAGARLYQTIIAVRSPVLATDA